MEELSGHLIAVHPETLGDAVAVASGTTGQLVIGDASDFDEDGGSVLVDGVTLTYTEILPTTVAGYDDPAALVLSAALGADVAEGTPVAMLAEGQPVTEWIGDVILDGQTEGESVEAEVDHALIPLLPEGALSGGGYAVTLADDGDGLRVVHPRGKAPELDGGYVVGTLPPEVLTDGSPPASSPTPVAVGLLRMVLLKWDAVPNADAVTYDVHVSTTSGFAEGPSTLHHSTAATLTTVSALPDGTPLAYETTYYLRIVARDGDGAAAAGGEVSAQLDPAGTADIAVGAVTADRLDSRLVVAGEVVTAESGRRSGMAAGEGLFTRASDESALFSMPDDATQRAYINVAADLLSMTVLGDAAFRGLVEFAQGTQVKLRSGTTAPVTAPSVTQTVASVAVTGEPSWRYGVALVSTGPTVVEDVQAVLWDTTVSSHNGLTGAALGFVNLPTGFSGRGIARLGTSRYLLGKKQSDSKWYIRRYDSTWTTLLDEWVLFSGSTTFPTGDPTLGTDGTDLLVALTNAGNLLLRKYSATDGSLLSSLVVSGFGASHFSSVSLGTFDYGASRWVVTTRDRSGGDIVRVYDTSGVRVSAEEWPLRDVRCAGVTWDGANFWSFSRDVGRLSQYSSDTWTASGDSTRRVANTWVHPTTGETLLGAKETFTAKKRWLTGVTIPALPAGVGSASVYLNRNTDTGPGSFWRQATGVTGTFVWLPVPVWSGTNAPGASTYPAGAPTELSTDSGLTYVRGDDTVRFGAMGYANRKKDSTQSVTASTHTTVTWPDVVDTAVGITYSAGVFTVDREGRYGVSASVQCAAGTTGRRLVRILRNGVEMKRAEANTAVLWTLEVSTPGVECTGGDTLEVTVFITGPASLNVGNPSQIHISCIG